MTDTGSSSFLARAYALRGAREAELLYDDWAASYDADTAEVLGYAAPAVAASRLAELVAMDSVVLDAGAGTGLVGAELAGHGFTTIDGMDISAAMLGKARARGVYRELRQADLNRPLPCAAGTYDAVICVGAFTEGHVGPGAFAEFVRVSRPGGLVVATVLDDIWEPHGYRQRIDELCRCDRVILHEAELRPYRTRQDVMCRLVVIETR